jgi:hypothetical protein
MQIEPTRRCMTTAGEEARNCHTTHTNIRFNIVHHYLALLFTTHP